MRKDDFLSARSCIIFSSLEDDMIKNILSDEKNCLCVYKKGEDIFSPEHFRKSLAVILKGKAEVIKENNGNSLFMNTLTSGSIFGVSTVYSEENTFPTTVRAAGDCRILFIDRENLSLLFARYPSVLEEYLTLLSNRIYFLNKKIESLSTPDARTSIKLYLEGVAEEKGKKEFTLPVSVSKLSEMLSLGRTSVYRAFEELTAGGFMEKNGKVIKLL